MKNVLAGVMNASAVLIFLFSRDIVWTQVLVAAVASVAGGQAGALALQRGNERILRIFIVVLGFGLSVGLFVKELYW
ncbi:MAG TPA: hypothetical protein DEA44_04285 [Firmicutes bacterium]|nr:hypothetical protein [Bacillota bacterium]